MESTEIVKFTKEETYKIFSDKIGKPVKKIRVSVKLQTATCEVGLEE